MKLFDRQSIDEAVWTELEELLIAADVGVNTAEKLISRVKQQASEARLNDGEQVRAALKKEMVNILTLPPKPPIENAAPPRVILVVGVNGSGKTTSIAKLAYSLKHQGKSLLLAAADTFRAAAIDQIKTQGERVGVEVVAHQPGADPGAVVFDALQAGRSRRVDYVIIDTAGRLHTKFNLMEEL
ncbi:MAG: signal recognition particle receptor subunit alpha, partial [Dehalococcoidales bacterium]|nr:signal recognition particle receptor subunit alpha [Dehalococcoidales bacterium]